jgi:predicted transcriptional regulator
MSTVTLRIPDDKHERLKALAKARHISVNKLLDELATIALAEFDAKTRFIAQATLGNPERGLALLDKLDRLEQEAGLHP